MFWSTAYHHGHLSSASRNSTTRSSESRSLQPQPHQPSQAHPVSPVPPMDRHPSCLLETNATGLQNARCQHKRAPPLPENLAVSSSRLQPRTASTSRRPSTMLFVNYAAKGTTLEPEPRKREKMGEKPTPSTPVSTSGKAARPNVLAANALFFEGPERRIAITTSCHFPPLWPRIRARGPEHVTAKKTVPHDMKDGASPVMHMHVLGVQRAGRYGL